MIDINELRNDAKTARFGHTPLEVPGSEVLELLDRLEEARTAWKEADKACRDLTEKVIPNLRESLEAAEKERDDVAQQLVQSEIGKREISEAHNAVTGRLSDLADENTALRAKVNEMEQQEPVAWMLNCPTLGGDTGWILSWTQSGAGLCNRLQGEENEKRLYAIPGAQPAPDVDALAQLIREIDGKHQLGAGALAERIVEWLAAAPEAKP